MSPLQARVLLVVAVLGAILMATEVWRRTRPGPPEPSFAESLDARRARLERVNERIESMMPDPGHEPQAPTPTPRPPDDDRVILEVLPDGAVRHGERTYALGAQDEAARTAAAEGLRAALLAIHEARGGDALREADGRSGLELTLRGAGAIQPDALARLIEVCGRPPLRAYRFVFDLQPR